MIDLDTLNRILSALRAHDVEAFEWAEADGSRLTLRMGPGPLVAPEIEVLPAGGWKGGVDR